MPKNRKEESDDSSSNSGSDVSREPTPPPKKKSKVSTAKVLKDNEGNSYWELERNRRVSVRDFRGKTYVDIREFYEKDNKILPGKKGIALSITQWNLLKGLIGEIDDGIQEIA